MGLAVILETIGKSVVPAIAPVWHVGTEAIAFKEAPPRIVAELVGEEIEPPHGQVGDRQRRPRRLLTRVCEVRFHVWGETMAQAEAMQESLRNVIHVLAAGSYRSGPARWVETGLAARGAIYVCSVMFLVPVNREETLGLLTDVPITPLIDNDPSAP